MKLTNQPKIYRGGRYSSREDNPASLKKESAFTLIELLVVIAIIGILASVVIASLNSARNKGKDVSIKSQLAQLRSQAALFYNTHGSYANGATGGSDDTFDECFNPANGSFTKFVGSMFDSSVSENISAIGAGIYNSSKTAAPRVNCATYAETWAFAAPLHNPESGTTGWCVDSRGTSKSVNIDFSTTSGALVSGGVARCP